MGLPAPLDRALPRTLALWLTEPLSWSLPPPMRKALCFFRAPVSSAAFRKESYRPWSRASYMDLRRFIVPLVHPPAAEWNSEFAEIPANFAAFPRYSESRIIPIEGGARA